MDVSRRAVLGAAAGSAAFAVLGVDASSADAATTAVPLLRAHYAGSVGKAFVAVHAGHSYRVTLTAIRDAVPAAAKDKPYRFILIFAPARGTRLHDGTYRLTRSGVHTHDLFLSSVGTAGLMQAVVNRVVR